MRLLFNLFRVLVLRLLQSSFSPLLAIQLSSIIFFFSLFLPSSIMPASSMYSKDEKVLCFHHDILYDAKILEVRHKDAADKKSVLEYLVHYKGWKNT